MTPDHRNDSWGDHMLSEMSLAEKIGQMTQVSNQHVTPAEVADHAIGSVLSGGNGNPTPNTPEVWADMVGSFVEAAEQSRLGIPLVYGVDAVHGHGNVGGATIFPHNIGLGAAGDEDLVRRIGRTTAVEMLATGVRWAFSPTVAVAHDIRWGRTYESYARDPALVARLGAAHVAGLQHDRDGSAAVLACAKHFIGDGATTWGSVTRPDWVHWWDDWGDNWQIDQGDSRIPETELRRVHLHPYEAVIAAGAQSIMASYSSWNGTRSHAHHGLLTNVLKHDLGFSGFVISDWMGVDQIDPSYERSVIIAINAGIDVVMVPIDFRRFIRVAITAVEDGAIPIQRVDDAVTRVLRAKSALGLADARRPDAPPLSVVGAAEHRALAAEAARRTAVLLKNDGALPLRPGTGTMEIAGRAAHDVGLQCGGWTVGWQGGVGPVTPGTTLVDALRHSTPGNIAYDPAGAFPEREGNEVGIVCVAEPPYAEGLGDSALPSVSDADREIFTRMRQRVDTLILVIYSGRPLVATELITRADAVVAAWLPGSEATELPSLLMGKRQFEGTLPQPWPESAADLSAPERSPLYPTGHGLRFPSAPEMVPTSRNDEGGP